MILMLFPRQGGRTTRLKKYLAFKFGVVEGLELDVYFCIYEQLLGQTVDAQEQSNGFEVLPALPDARRVLDH